MRVSFYLYPVQPMSKIISSAYHTRKEVILSKAAQLFREKGYSATSMRDLAEAVGVEAASLYNHIKSKAEILQEICLITANRFMDNLTEIENSDRSDLERIEAVLRFHIQEMIQHYEETYVLDREWRHLIEPHLHNLQSQRRSYRQRLATIIESGKIGRAHV